MKYRILGIDPSLTSLGYAFVAANGKTVTGTVRSKFVTGPQRLRGIRDAVLNILNDAQPTLVAYEGYAMGRFSGGGRAFDLGELGGVLKLMIFESKIQLLLVPPTSLKLFATGSGRADKDAVRVAMAKHRGQLFKSDDEADAYALFLMGSLFCDARQRPRDPRHFRYTALRGCELVQAV